MKKISIGLLLIIIFAALILGGCSSISPDLEEAPSDKGATDKLTEVLEDGIYSKPEDVAEYIHIYEKLPQNYITKKEAEEAGWENSKGNLWEVTDKKSIGGDRFGNREGRLPKAEGRKWYECDVNYKGGYRGAERVLFSDDGLIYYTEDHYETFTQLY